jgi:RNA polymerase sigma-70 factor (ECF subfamily)
MAWKPTDLIPDYQYSLAIVRGCCRRRHGQPNELNLLNSMQADLEWTIKYMATGDDSPMYPNNRPVPIDPGVLQEWLEERQMQTPIHNADEARSDALMVLDELSDRELEAYLLVKGEGFSVADTARIMAVGKSTVQSYLERAKGKIAEAKECLPYEKGDR